MENNEEASSKFLYNTHGSYSSIKGDKNSGSEGMQQDNGKLFLKKTFFQLAILLLKYSQ